MVSKMDLNDSKYKQLLLNYGVLKSAEAKLLHLSGGVSSEIYKVSDGNNTFVVKRALAKLKVKENWCADTSRNFTEQAFIKYVAKFNPDAVPKLIYISEEHGFFAMEYLDGFANFKDELLAANLDIKSAEQAGKLLGEIHSNSWQNIKTEQEFDTLKNFDELRIDPYLRATLKKHPQLSEQFQKEITRLRVSKKCLVHGDYSPKNILYRNNRLVILDCEVAWYGCPAFDLSFFLNHFFLKSLYHSPKEYDFNKMIDAVMNGYSESNPKHVDEVKNNCLLLLPMLMLARVDGKSTVEYLTDENKKDFIREFANEKIKYPENKIETLQNKWFAKLNRR